MSLIHDLAVKLKVLQNHKAVLESENSIDILSKTLRFSQLYSSTEMTHSNVHPLGDNNILFDGWNKGYIVQSAMWNNSKTRFFKITVGRVRLDYEMVASMLAA
jgi:hypothetical protein